MPKSNNYYSFVIVTLLLGFDGIIFLLNAFFFGYAGNNYLPNNNTPVICGLILLLLIAGTRLQFNRDHFLISVIDHVNAFYLVMILIAITTNAIQYTPFPPIDQHIVQIEHFFHLNLPAFMVFIAGLPTVKFLLNGCYNTLPYEMAVLPLTFIFLGYFNRIKIYLNLMLISAAIGFIFYFFFPTLGPASAMTSPLFIDEQYATGIKFNDIHHYLRPSTLAGGMIAMPSYHVIWAWLCLYLSQDMPVLLILLIPYNSLIIVACVGLGWHYPLDVLGSIIVILLSHILNNRLFRPEKTPGLVAGH